MVVLSQKLKALKCKLKVWNKEIFGYVNSNVQNAMQHLELVQHQIDSVGYSDTLIEQERSMQIDLDKALCFQEQFWSEKSRLQWHTSGDRNIQFIHKVTKFRSVTKQITMLKSRDSVLDNSKDIEQHVVTYFEDPTEGPDCGRI